MQAPFYLFKHCLAVTPNRRKSLKQTSKGWWENSPIEVGGGIGVEDVKPQKRPACQLEGPLPCSKLIPELSLPLERGQRNAPRILQGGLQSRQGPGPETGRDLSEATQHNHRGFQRAVGAPQS